jgi:hypothetical protein
MSRFISVRNRPCQWFSAKIAAFVNIKNCQARFGHFCQIKYKKHLQFKIKRRANKAKLYLNITKHYSIIFMNA